MVCLLNESLPAILSKRPGSDSLASLGNHSNEPSERYGRAIFGEPAGRFPFLSPGRPLNPASAPHRSPASSRCAPVEGAALALLPFDEDVIRFICVTVSAVIVFELRIGTCIIGRTSDENSKLDVGPPVETLIGEAIQNGGFRIAVEIEVDDCLYMRIAQV